MCTSDPPDNSDNTPLSLYAAGLRWIVNKCVHFSLSLYIYIFLSLSNIYIYIYICI